MSTIRIGLPKGRGLEYTRQRCPRIDVAWQDGQSRYETRWQDRRILVYVLKFGDIARLVAAGSLDLGVTSEEWLLDAGVLRRPPDGGDGPGGLTADPDGVRLFHVPIYSARLCLLARSAGGDPGAIKAVASPYPNLSRHLTDGWTPRPEIIDVLGTSEALVPDFADAAIDVVETGRTARLHRLSVIAEYGPVATCLVRSRTLDPVAVAELVATFRC